MTTEESNKTRNSPGSTTLPVIIISILMGYLALWQVFESDIFYLIRAGKEVFETFSIQTVESWSYSARGEPWYNIQWMSTLIFYLTWLLDDEFRGFSILRAVLVFINFLLIGKLLLSAVKKNKKGRLVFSTIISFFFLPATFLMIWFRLQMRPELLNLPLFSIILLLWIGKPFQKRQLATFLLLLLWANIHTGTVILGIFIAILAALASEKGGGAFSKKIRKEGIWLFLFALTMIITPQGTRIFSVISQNVLSYDNSGMVNNDWLGFSEYFRMFPNFRLPFIIWISFTALSVSGYFTLKKKFPELLPGAFQNPAFFLTGSLALAFATLNRARILPYHLIFIMPVLGSYLFYRLRDSSGKQAINKQIFIATSVIAVFFLYTAFTGQGRFHFYKRGVSLSEEKMPLGALDFIKETKPKGRIFNNFNFGSHMLHFLPEYPVLMDNRDIPFRKLKKEVVRLYRSGNEETAKFTGSYGINIILEMKEGDVLDLRRRFPDKLWAIVYFDHISIVMLRKIPEHASIIKTHEFSSLLEAQSIFRKNVSPATLPDPEKVKPELQRCLKRRYYNAECSFIDGALMILSGSHSSAIPVFEKLISFGYRRHEAARILKRLKSKSRH